MGRFGDFDESKAVPRKTQGTKEIIIPRRTIEISSEAWDMTVEKAGTMSNVQHANSFTLKKTQVPKNDELD